MEDNDPQKFRLLLRRFAEGDQSAGEDLMCAIGTELHKIAAYHMRKERRDHTLQPTALVNEAYMKLIGHLPDECNDRSHFLGAASRAMRWFLIDYARRRPGGQKVELDTAHLVVGPVQPSVLDVDQALKELEAIAPRQAQLVELHFFGGLSLREAAGVLGMAPRTADNDWKLARAWLARRLSSG